MKRNIVFQEVAKIRVREGYLLINNNIANHEKLKELLLWIKLK